MADDELAALRTGQRVSGRVSGRVKSSRFSVDKAAGEPAGNPDKPKKGSVRSLSAKFVDAQHPPPSVGGPPPPSAAGQVAAEKVAREKAAAETVAAQQAAAAAAGKLAVDRLAAENAAAERADARESLEKKAAAQQAAEQDRAAAEKAAADRRASEKASADRAASETAAAARVAEAQMEASAPAGGGTIAKAVHSWPDPEPGNAIDLRFKAGERVTVLGEHPGGGWWTGCVGGGAEGIFPSNRVKIEAEAPAKPGKPAETPQLRAAVKPAPSPAPADVMPTTTDPFDSSDEEVHLTFDGHEDKTFAGVEEGGQEDDIFWNREQNGLPPKPGLSGELDPQPMAARPAAAAANEKKPVLVKKEELDARRTARAIFAQLDANGNGVIGREEFRATMGGGMDNAALDEAMADILDGRPVESVIDFEAFYKW
jgi:hypothetical protein